jgi:hypothetical protein
VSTGRVYLRNRDPTRRLAVPLGNGWARMILPPQTCTSVPAAVLRSAGVAAGLAAERIVVVTEVSASTNPDARAAAALRRNMAVAIARAEQRAFDKLRQPDSLKPRRQSDGRYQRWTPERLARFTALWLAGATLDEIAAATGLGRRSVLATGYAQGLPRRRAARSQAALLSVT